MTALDKVLAAVDHDMEASVGRLMEVLRIPSVSTDPAHKDDCRRTAQWFVEQLEGIGVEASLRDTPGQPMVVAHSGQASGGRPHVLFYGHYDVQPADPLDKWTTPPFDPVRRKDSDGVERIY